MQACAATSGGLLGAAVRRTWQRSATPQAVAHCRRHRLLLPVPLPAHRLRPSVATAAAAPDGEVPAEESSAILRLAAEAGGKLTKTAVSRLGVADLRAECQRLQLPTDGLKAALVERLMTWWQEQQQGLPQQQQSSSQLGTTGSREAAEGAAAIDAAMPAAALEEAAAPAAAAPSASSGAASPRQEGSRQPQQQRQRRQGPGGPVRVTWLGTSSGNPTPRRNVSAVAVQFGDDLFMVDCGEGTRNQLRKTKLEPAQLRAVFVTHMHGDHCFGVSGMIAAVMEARLGTPQQSEPLHLFGPPELQSLVLAAVRMSRLVLTTPVVVTGFVLDPQRARPPTKVDEAGMLQMALQAPDQASRLPPELAKSWQAAYDQGSEDIVQKGLTWTVRMPGGPLVGAAQLQHRVPCWGYVFQEPSAVVPPPRSAARRSAAGAAEVDAAAVGDWQQPVQGQEQGRAVAEQEQEEEPQQQLQRQGEEQWVQRGRRLVILGDTCDSSAIVPLAMGCDLLSHEATFCSGMEEKAAIAQHSTTLQAGAFAAAVDAQRLVLTHFSARYESYASVRTVRQRPQQRGRDRDGGRDRDRDGGAGAGEASDLRRSDLAQLLDETVSTYGRDTLDLAYDFFTVEVPLPAPMPASQLQQQQAQQAAAAAAGGYAPQQREAQQVQAAQQQQPWRQYSQPRGMRGGGGQQQGQGRWAGGGQYQQQQRGPRGEYQQYQQQRRPGPGSSQYRDRDQYQQQQQQPRWQRSADELPARR